MPGNFVRCFLGPTLGSYGIGKRLVPNGFEFVTRVLYAGLQNMLSLVNDCYINTADVEMLIYEGQPRPI
jgi:hypothetical protein